MARLDDLLPNTSVDGILPDGLVTVVNVQEGGHCKYWLGDFSRCSDPCWLRNNRHMADAH